MDFIARRVPGLKTPRDCEIVRTDPTKYDDEPELREQATELSKFGGERSRYGLTALRDRIVVASPGPARTPYMSESQAQEVVGVLVAKGHEVDDQIAPLGATVKDEPALALAARVTAKANKGSKNHKAPAL